MRCEIAVNLCMQVDRIEPKWLGPTFRQSRFDDFHPMRSLTTLFVCVRRAADAAACALALYIKRDAFFCEKLALFVMHTIRERKRCAAGEESAAIAHKRVCAPPPPARLMQSLEPGRRNNQPNAQHLSHAFCACASLGRDYACKI